MRLGKRIVREWVQSIGSTLLFVWLFTSHVAQATEVPTESMKPSILPGDHFFLDKLGFEANYPSMLKPYLPSRTVSRREIVAFWSPADRNTRLVKRVIGLPGETVEIRNKEVFIDDVRLNEPYKVHTDPTIIDQRDNFGPVTVPPDSYFMMGDNRENSNDSRFWGFARKDDLIGRPLFIYWSYDVDPYMPAESAGEILLRYASTAMHFFDRTRWFRTGTIVR